MMIDYHRALMKYALQEAHKALKKDEVPIGAVVVNQEGVIQGRGYNLVEIMHQQSAHAEIRSIDQACRKRNDWRLEDCWIYVTLEPCSMCMSLIILSRVKGLVYGASSPKFGYRLEPELTLEMNKNTLEILSGVCHEESAFLLKEFFKRKR